MNQELKNLLNIAFDAVNVGEDIAGKNYVALIGDMTKLMGDSPAAISDFSDLQNEIKALPGSAQEADLISYVESKFSGIGSAKAQQILAIGLKMVQDLVIVVQDALTLKASI